MLEYWYHHQIVLSGDGQPDLKPQVRCVRGVAGEYGKRKQQVGVRGGGHVSDTETGLIYIRARFR